MPFRAEIPHLCSAMQILNTYQAVTFVPAAVNYRLANAAHAGRNPYPQK